MKSVGIKKVQINLKSANGGRLITISEYIDIHSSLLDFYLFALTPTPDFIRGYYHFVL